MPKKPGLPQKRNTIAITYQQILCLIERKNRIPGQHFKSEIEREQAWKHNRAAIMKLQGQPLDIGEDTMALQRSLRRDVWFACFERPLAFYEYDMHEILTGHPPDKRTLFFIESTCCGVEYDADVDQAPPNATIYRNQKEYLIKNNLLNAAEKRLLKAEKAKNE
jgi:hypothetical protein